jgi:hypothetical protein
VELLEMIREGEVQNCNPENQSIVSFVKNKHFVTTTYSHFEPSMEKKKSVEYHIFQEDPEKWL